jgi:hypothetical protein
VLRVVGSGLQVVSCGLQVVSCELWVASCGMRVRVAGSGCVLRVASCGMWVASCGIWIAGRNHRIQPGNWQAAKAVSLIERETNEYRTSNAQHRTSNNVFCPFKIKIEHSKRTLGNSTRLASAGYIRPEFKLKADPEIVEGNSYQVAGQYSAVFRLRLQRDSLVLK